MKLKITVHGVAYEVDVEVLDAGEGFIMPSQSPLPRVSRQSGAAPAPRSSNTPSAAASTGGDVVSPIGGTVLEVKCKPGDAVEKDQILLVIEAMKMETSIAAPMSGKVKSLDVAVGDTVRENQVLVRFE